MPATPRAVLADVTTLPVEWLLQRLEKEPLTFLNNFRQDWNGAASADFRPWRTLELLTTLLSCFADLWQRQHF
jgi:hypothetical protein